MRSDNVYLYGAGGHGRVVYDSMIEAGCSSDNIFVMDDNSELVGDTFLSTNICGVELLAELRNLSFHVSIGNNSIRNRIFIKFEDAGAVPFSVFHPSSAVSRFAFFGTGVFVAAKAILAASSRIGKGVIVNHGSVIDHDCLVGDFCHIAPNATIAGGVKIGNGVLIGSGAIVFPGLEIGSGSVIGAGAVVRKNVSDGKRVAGIPAVEI